MRLNHFATKPVALIKAKKASKLQDVIFAHVGQKRSKFNRTKSCAVQHIKQKLFGSQIQLSRTYTSQHIEVRWNWSSTASLEGKRSDEGQSD